MNMQIDSSALYIEKDELLDLLKKAYEEGSFGYLDLKDATAGRILEEYLLERKDKPPLPGKFEAYPYDLEINRTGIQIGIDTGISGIQIASAPSIDLPSVVSFDYTSPPVTITTG